LYQILFQVVMPEQFHSTCVACNRPVQILLEGLCGACLREGMLRGLTEPDSSDLGGTGDPVHILPKKGHTAEHDPFPEIQDFEILSYIAEGGFSIVYRGEQLYPIRRMVAIKVIKRGIDSEEILERFRAEQNIIARMDHPNVARVLHAGETKDGRPFIAMEFIDGRSIATYCDDFKLTLDERLGLFQDACEAILHAHQRGVIHRDIKPSNIMVSRVSGRAVLKVIDFGIAKILEDAPFGSKSLTIEGMVMGTPEFMSPEQLSYSRDIDVRTDIYSLGLVLYGLVAGRHPLDLEALAKLSVREACERLLVQEYPKPSEVARGKRQVQAGPETDVTPKVWWKRVPGDLDRVILKALEKNRLERYSSVTLLALDIQAFLRHMPVSVARPTAAYQIRKFIRRNRKATVAMALSVFVVSAVAVERNAIRRAEGESRRLLEGAVAKHEAEIRAAMLAGEENLGEVVVNVPDLLEGATLPEVIQMLNNATDEYLKHLPQSIDAHLVVGHRSKLLLQRSLLARWRGDPTKAILLARDAVKTFSNPLDSQYASQKAMAHRLLAFYLEESSRPADANATIEEAMRCLEISPTPAAFLKTACLALRTRILVGLGRSAEASTLVAKEEVIFSQDRPVEQAAAELELLLGRATARAEMLEFAACQTDLRAVEKILASLPEDVSARHFFKLEKAMLMEIDADLLDRSESQRQAAMALFDASAALRREVMRLSGENPSHVLGAVRNHLEAGTWLLDLAGAIDRANSNETVVNLAAKQFTAAEELLPHSATSGVAIATPEKSRLEILLKSGLAECRLLQNQPLAALDWLDSVALSSASLLRDLPQDLRHIELRSRVLCLRALCFEQLNEPQKAAESLREERQLMNERMPVASSAARTWLRAATRYARAGYSSQAAETLRKALGQISANHVAFPVLTEKLERVLPPR